MFIKKIAILLIIIVLIMPFSVFGDIYDKNINYDEIVTEYYSSDLYDNIVETSAIPTTSLAEVDCESAILMEASTGKIIYKKNENKRLSPASIVKIMTMLLVVEAIESKKLSFYDKATCSEHASSMGGSQIWLEVGEAMTVHDLLKSVAVGSANDASVVLAEHIAGSEEAFVAQMNEKAKELGMKNTNFTNACGLDDDNLYTTAKDVALMSRALISHEIIKQYTTIWMDTIRNESVQLVNTNKLVRFYKGATGLKTGTTDKAGCCLSATAKRNDMELIAVIMNAKSSKDRFSFAKKLLDFGFANLTIFNPNDKIKIKKHLKITDGQKTKIKINYDKIQNELIKTDDKEKIEIKIKLNNSLKAPVHKSDIVGKIIIANNEKVLNQYNIRAGETVEKVNFKFSFLRLFHKMASL